MGFLQKTAKRIVNNLIFCIFCDIRVQCQYAYHKHLRVHTKERSCICRVCFQEYPDSKSLNKHQMEHSQDGNNSALKCSEEFQNHPIIAYVKDVQVQHKSKSCSKSFSTAGRLNKPTRFHNEGRQFKCDLCSSAFYISSDLRRHVISVHQNPGTFKCNLCHAKFNLKYKFEDHLRRHTGEKPHQCISCESACTSKNELSRHQTRRHSDTPKLICVVCDKSLKSRDSLVDHMQNIHKKIKVFQCHICDKNLSCRLRVHVKGHGGEKPYKCGICTKAFMLRSRLDGHLKTHTISGKAFACNEFSMAFSIKYELTRHQKIHANRKDKLCVLCSKRFFQWSQLAYHVKIHSNEKPCMCHKCGEEFDCTYRLKVHKMKYCE